MFRPLRLRTPRLVFIQSIRCQSTSTSAPFPLLAKVRSELKDAMRAKDKTRLEVLRALISEVNNAAKTPRPIETDSSFMQLIRKRCEAVKNAREDYVHQNRNDLKVKADAEINVLEQYAALMVDATAEDIQQAVSQAIEKVKADGKKVTMGRVMKTISFDEKPLQGKFVEQSNVATAVQNAISHN